MSLVEALREEAAAIGDRAVITRGQRLVVADLLLHAADAIARHDRATFSEADMRAIQQCLLAYAENHMPDYWYVDPGVMAQWLTDGNRRLPQHVARWVISWCNTCQETGTVLRDDAYGGLINDSCPDCTKAAE